MLVKEGVNYTSIVLTIKANIAVVNTPYHHLSSLLRLNTPLEINNIGFLWTYLIFMFIQGITSKTLRKCNSCSTIFIDDSTVSQPNLKYTIKWYGIFMELAFLIKCLCNFHKKVGSMPYFV